ncbi:MAG: hypothetical protein ACLP8A_01935 [Methylovirgula sp.]
METVVMVFLAICFGIAASLVGGAVGGVLVGGKAIGNELAALMGGFYGPLAGATGTFIGILLFSLMH